MTTIQELFQRYCKYLKVYPDLGFSVDISRMSFDDSFFPNIEFNIKDAFEQMSELEKGAIANPDENRMVGHYWLRTPALSPNEEIRDSITSTLGDLRTFARWVHSGLILSEQQTQFRNVLLIGIGGSALGPQFISDALWSHEDPMKLYFCDNTDPDGIQRTLTELGSELGRTLVIVISKSGGTAETNNGLLEVKRAYEQSGLRFGAHAVAITSKGSKLDKFANEQSWVKTFEMWDWVGGRTSVFSAVGLLPAALQGVNVDDFLEGAKQMDALTRVRETLDNPAALLSLMWFFSGKGKGTKEMVIIPYKDRLALFGKYLQQLVMESLGKAKNLKGVAVKQGLTVYGNKGSTDQHAYIQQLRDGLDNFFVTFIEVLSDYAYGTPEVTPYEVEPEITTGDFLSGFYLGTRRALTENGRDSITLTIDKLDARSLGALIALYDRAVGLYAFLIHINAYHQPGVEAGKKAASRVIAIQRAVITEIKKHSSPENAASAQKIASAIGYGGEGETVYKILERLSENPSRGVMRSGGRLPKDALYSFES